MSPPARRLVAAGCVIAALVAVIAARRPGPDAFSLVTGSPADGQVLATGPGSVTLRFSRSVDSALSHLAVAGPDGVQIDAGEARPAGTTGLELPVRIVADGAYTIGYHAVAADGAEARGLLRFGVGPGAVPDAGNASALPAHDHGVDPLSAVLLVIDAVVFGGAVLLLLLRRRRPAVRE